MNNKLWKRWVFLCFVFVPIVLVVIGTVNYIVDPFQFFRRDNNPMFSINQRYQNPGLLKNYDYDTLILGTSMSENFRKSYIDGKLGTNSLRASIAGGTIYEQFLTQQLAISSNKNLKKIIWLMDIFSLAAEPEATVKNFPVPLYTGDVSGITLRYLLSSYVFMEAFFRATGLYASRDAETLNNWSETFEFSTREVLSTYKKQEFVYNPKDDAEKNITLNIKKYVVFEKNPDIEYMVIFPPYSFIAYCVNGYKPNLPAIEASYTAKTNFISFIKRVKNVVIYDFQDAYEIIYDLNNYKDSSHYSQAVNDWMIDRIAEKDEKYLVRDEETYQKRQQNFVRAINITSGIGELVSDDNLEEHLEFLRKNILEALQ